MEKDFNAPNALYAAVNANDVELAKKLIEAGVKPDSHMLAIAIDDDFAIPQQKNSVGSDDLLMAKLLLKHGANVNGNDHEPIIEAVRKPSVLGLFLIMLEPGCDLKGALNSLKTLPKYAGPEYRKGEEFLGHFLHAQREGARKRRVRLHAAKKNDRDGRWPQ